MDLAERLLKQISNTAISDSERARLRVRLSKALEESGDYEGARSAMEGLWSRMGERPILKGLEPRAAAEVLLQVGILTSCIGSAKQFKGAQELAKDLICESITIFEDLQDADKVARAQADLAVCYWRLGAFSDAQAWLGEALNRLSGSDNEVKALVLIRSAMVESVANRLNDALRVYIDAAPFFKEIDSHALKGKFHVGLAIVLKNLSVAEHREDYIDRAFIEFAAASYHFEQAGHKRFRARVDNNLALLFCKVGKFTEAHKHAEQARKIFVNLGDSGSVAQVDDTRAKVLLTEGRNAEAERVAHAAVKTLEKGDEQSQLAGAMMTHGMALARTGKHEWARMTLECAALVAERASDLETAGQAVLTIIEELAEQSVPAEMGAIYERAAELLAGSRDPSIPARMAECARKVMRLLAAQGGEAQAAELQSPKGLQSPAEELKAPADWEGFSFKSEIRRYERLLIERALRDSNGVVTRAAQLLGFKHHYSLITLMNRRHKDLIPARSPVIPRRRSIVRDAAGRAQKTPGGGEPRPVTILHVEDNKLIADALKETLEAEGWKVEPCADGISAVTRLVGDEPFDLLLFDYDLPGVNGIELLRLARKLPHRRRTPSIMLSASDVEAEAWRAGADGFLSKPKDVSSVADLISRLLKR